MRLTPTAFVIGSRVLRQVAVLLVLSFLLTRGAPVARATAPPAVPAALAELQSFRGRVSYRAHRLDDPAATAVAGTLTVSGDGWVLEERGQQTLLHASNVQSWIRTGSQTTVFDDPFEVQALVNSWTALLGSNAGADMMPNAAGSSWTSGSGLRIYLDAAATEIVGVADTRSPDGISFTYADWVAVNGLRLPQSILRLRAGVQDASYAVDGYEVAWAPKNAAAAPGRMDVAPAPQGPVINAGTPHLAAASSWRPFFTLFAFCFLALGFIAWTRRDALFDRLCRRLAADPRAWRREGTDVFVSPEGVLFFEGRPYHVGAAFYNQATSVQSSPFFIRVSAPTVSRVVVLAKKFPLPHAWRAAAKRSAAGFTLLEALASTALFGAVIVAVVFPGLIVLAQADHIAAQHQTATQIAANALVDEEAALEYGTAVSDASATLTINGMILSVTVSPSAIAGLHDVVVQVTDASHRPLARVATMVGPPVPPPAATPSPSAP